MNLQRLLHTELGQTFISILLGLGLATYLERRVRIRIVYNLMVQLLVKLRTKCLNTIINVINIQ